MFSEIVGHDRQSHYFNTIIKQNRLSHAYCFKGASGIGKYTFAKAIARQLLCSNDDICLSKFDANSHPDFMSIRSDGKILTEQIEQVQHFINVKPYLANIKVVVIDDAANIVEQAQNKLLKLLEEPPGHALIFFITQNDGKLLTTVRSRMIDVAFSPLSEEHIKTLCQKYQISYNNTYYHMVSGSFGHYLKWTTDATFKNNIESLISIMLEIVANQPEKWLEKLKVLTYFKDKSYLIFDMNNLVLQDLTLIYNDLSADKLRLSQYTKSMIQYKKVLTYQALTTIANENENARLALLRGQNYDLITEGLFFKIQEAIHG